MRRALHGKRNIVRRSRYLLVDSRLRVAEHVTRETIEEDFHFVRTLYRLVEIHGFVKFP